jgi:hypothetical protein
MNVDTIKFSWKSQQELPEDDPTKRYQYYGLIANQLDEIFPELVYDDSEHLQVNYAELIPIMINAIKDLKHELDSCRDSIKYLKNENKLDLYIMFVVYGLWQV